MDGHCAGPSLLGPCGYGMGLVLARYAQQSGWFVENGNAIVVIDGDRLLLRPLALLWVGIDKEALQHP